MSQEETVEIRRVPAAESGTPDGVELLAKCNVTSFAEKENTVTISGHQVENCKMLASFENGIVSISVRGKKRFMVSVRLGEMMALIKAAADYNREVDPQRKGEGKKGGKDQ